MISADFIRSLRGICEATFDDLIEVHKAANQHDGYGDTESAYPVDQSFSVMGRLQPVQRIPGTPEAGQGENVIGEFVIVVPVGNDFDNQCRCVVNHGDTYQVMNVYADKADAATVQLYCMRIKH